MYTKDSGRVLYCNWLFNEKQNLKENEKHLRDKVKRKEEQPLKENKRKEDHLLLQLIWMMTVWI
jgi:hypothetical protein